MSPEPGTRKIVDLLAARIGASKMKAFDRITRHGFTTYEPDQIELLLRAASFTQVRTVPLSGRVSQGDFVSVAIA